MLRYRVVPATHPARKNIVIFGESGVGKSSLVNLIAGQTIAATSSSARGCTSHHTKYELRIDDTLYAIWDTPGLDEGTCGTVPAEVAKRHLKQLLHDLNKAGGVHLLIYCIRGSRVLETLLRNYNLFYSAICRKKVPIVVVATRLEYYRGEMADWWTTNGKRFTTFKMHFDGHACVTTLDADKVDSPALKQRCLESRQTIRSLIADTCARDCCGAEQEGWTLAALTDMRGMLKPKHHSRSMAPIIALYDLSGHSPDPTGSARDALPFKDSHLMDVNGSPFLVYRIHDENLLAGARFKKQVSLRGADLLIFCASVHDDLVASWKWAAAFYQSYGGDMRPFLIIIRDALSDEEAHVWYKKAFGDKDVGGCEHACHPGKIQAIVCYLPPPESPDMDSAVIKIQRTILMHSLEPVDVVPAGYFGRISGWMRRVKLHTGHMDAAHIQEDSLTAFRVWAPFRTH